MKGSAAVELKRKSSSFWDPLHKVWAPGSRRNKSATLNTGKTAEAAEVLSRASERIPQPNPDLFLERARFLQKAGQDTLTGALIGPDEGLRRLGPVVSLQTAAIEIELLKENYPGALARLATIEASANRKEKWLVWHQGRERFG